MEIRLERQTRKIEKYTARADAAIEGYNYSSAAKNYVNAISSSAAQITYNEQGSKKYKETADQVLSNAVGKGIINSKTAKNIAKQVADGTIDINKYDKNVQEVIKSYQEWYNKSLDCADAVETLHQNIRKYVQGLKDARDSQRDLSIQQSESLSTIATSGYASSSGVSYGLANSQLNYSNYNLKQQNNAYNEETRNTLSDVVSLGKTANSSIITEYGKVNSTISSKTKGYSKKRADYKKALKNAQNAIKSKKPVSASDLKVIKAYSTSTYEKLYAYNLQLENVDAARMEQATNYAATSSQIFQNIAETYKNMDNASNNKIDLYKNKADNAASASKANAFIKNIISEQNTILNNDAAEVNKYSSIVKSKQATIAKGNNKHHGNSYSSLSKEAKENVNKYIDAAQKAAKSGKAISASLLAILARYYSKGYITVSFYNACIDYNNALESRHEAEAQYDIDQETAKAEKKSLLDSQRNNSIEESNKKLSIATSGYTSSSGQYYGLKNSQIDAQIAQLKAQNSAYAEEVSNAKADVNKTGAIAKSNVSSALKKANGEYKKALQNAQAAIKTKKPVSSGDLKIIKKYNSTVYNRIVSYNNALDNLEIAGMEQATNYAATSSQIFQNIAETYKNMDNASNNKIDLYKKKADNAASAKSKNKYLKDAASQYDTILANDRKEITEYSNSMKSKQKIIAKDNSKQYGTNYTSLSKDTKNNVNKYIDAAQKAAKSGTAISASLLTTLAKYYSKGYITAAFYQACIDYNNALESKREAEAQYAIDQETAKAEKASIGSSMLENVMQEYTNKSNKNGNYSVPR